ncbi:MAG: pseudouridine synthase [Treponemataceae bacterium]
MKFLQPIDHFFSFRKICSQRSFSVFIKNHKVLVNSKPVTDRAFLVNAEKDFITVDGVRIKNIKHLYFMMNKGKDVVCSRVSSRHKTVFDFMGEFAKEKLLHIAGRLDADSTGLLILTTNGSFSNFITDPNNSIEKTYEVVLKNPVLQKDQNKYIEGFLNGIYLDDLKQGSSFTTKSCKLEFTSETTCCVKICEGKFRQVRRMFSFFGNEVAQLNRTGVANFCLDKSLCKNHYRFLTNEELKIYE